MFVLNQNVTFLGLDNDAKNHEPLDPIWTGINFYFQKILPLLLYVKKAI